MKSDLTEIIFVLDRSGSMNGLENDTIGGYNSFLKIQRETQGGAKVTTVLFDDEYIKLHDRVDINNVKPITEKEYFARGTTALLDAIGKTIADLGVTLRDTQEEERPSKIIFVIITDGNENASREFTYKKVNEMISRQQNKYNWEFIFLGANIDATAEAENLGIKASRFANYIADEKGTCIVYSELAENVASFRTKGKIKESWNENINKDINKRKSKGMKKLVRTVPVHLCDDRVVHEDIMDLDTQIITDIEIDI